MGRNRLQSGVAMAVAALTSLACVTEPTMKSYKDIQLTHDASGHCVNTTQVFSPDDDWIVYDSRNVDSGIMGAGEVAMVHTQTGEIRTLYQAPNQTAFGPGVGAVTFSPAENRVLFIHGIRNANREHPYSMTRRTGVSVVIDKPFHPEFLDARNIITPFTPGALRGGTHAHTWSGDGKWISYTYNDFLIEQAALAGKDVKDLRTIGVMIPGQAVAVPADGRMENNDGVLFSVIVAEVTDRPEPGTDQIEKAFDECWIGKDGYTRPDGTRQRKAIAYQGNVLTEEGTLKTEIFVADLPDDLLAAVENLMPSADPAVRLPVPEVVRSRRITLPGEGVTPEPRHWLRSTPDGEWIGFLAADTAGNAAQLHVVSPNGGAVRQVTVHPFPIQGPFNFSADGKRVAYIADNSVFITELASGASQRITPRSEEADRPLGAVVWSNNDKMLCYNRYVKQDSGNYLQVFLLKEVQ